MWGRGLGLYFLAPFTLFLAKRWLTPPLTRRLLAIFAAGGAQGLIGWWMVKARAERTPRTSQCTFVAHWSLPRTATVDTQASAHMLPRTRTARIFSIPLFLYPSLG